MRSLARHIPFLWLHVFSGAILVAVLLTCPGKVLYAANEGLLRDFEIFAEIERIGSSTGMSLAPILAYEPTFGLIYGGAVFLEKPFAPEYAFNSRLAFSTEGEYSVLLSLKKFYYPDRHFHLELEMDDFARPYYGEGMNTDASDQIFLQGMVSRFLYFLKYRTSGKVSWGPFLDFRSADSTGVDGSDVIPPEYEEVSLGFGLNLFYDGRDSQLSPTTGVYDTLILRLVPNYLTSYDDSSTFFQAEVDHRIFRSPTAGLILAGRFHLGSSWGRPSYQYRYSLGGPYELRGFYNNRFRGKRFYCLQGEVRKNLNSIISGAVFAEVGEVTDGDFDSPETSFGAGLRMTLPPDHIAKVRLDFAWAQDQQSIYFIFGEAF